MTETISMRLAGVASARRSARDWRALMRAYSRSHETRKQFCIRHGVALSTFDWWRRRLRQNSPTRVASQPSSAAQANALFIELAQEATPITAASSSWDVELELDRGMFLRLRRAAC